MRPRARYPRAAFRCSAKSSRPKRVAEKCYGFPSGTRFNSLQENLQPNVIVNITYSGRRRMSVKSVQFAVATHIMAALGIYPDGEIGSATLADSVKANPTFVRKSLSKLSKAG